MGVTILLDLLVQAVNVNRLVRRNVSAVGDVHLRHGGQTTAGLTAAVRKDSDRVDRAESRASQTGSSACCRISQIGFLAERGP
eukprot:COSAG01_NODE_5462_length_4249_cov_3.039759_5_plen_82_part_01